MTKSFLIRYLRASVAIVVTLFAPFALTIQDIPNVAVKHILPDELEYIEFVESIAQDSQGFMWFGGRNGLARFDGYEIRRFEKTDEPDSIQSNQINEIILSSDGILWIATGQGLHSYDKEQESFVQHFLYNDKEFDRSANNVETIVEADDGGLWLGTRSGLIHYSPTTQDFTRYYHDAYPPDSGNLQINALFVAKDGRLWIGQKTGGLSVFDPKTSLFKHYRHNPDDPNTISLNDINELFIDSTDTLWIGTYNAGINRMKKDGSGFVRYPYTKKLENEDVWEFIEDKKGRVWVGDGGGLALYDRDKDDFHRYVPSRDDPRSIRHRSVKGLFLDNAGDIWIGFYPSGIDYIEPQASVFKNYMAAGTDTDSLLGNGVRGTYVDENSNIWISTGTGISFLDRRTNTFTGYVYEEYDLNGISGLIGMSIVGDEYGYIWFGIYGEGLNRLDPKTGDIKHYSPRTSEPNGLVGDQPWGMLIDKDGDHWITTNLGLNRYNRDTDDFTLFLPTTEQVDGQSFYTRVIYQDSFDNIWIGSTRGLFLFNKENGKFKRFTTNDGMSVNYVLSLYDDKEGSLWIGTKGGGLNRYDYRTGQFEGYMGKIGLHSEVISTMVGDHLGNIWMGTHNGLTQFHPKTNKVKNYTKTQGMSGNLFNKNTLSLSASGEIVAGTNDGLTIFHPEELWENEFVPPVWITELSIFNEKVEIGGEKSPLHKSVTLQKKIKLTHEQSVFSLKFAALNYRSPEENSYQYMLEGFDKTWHAASKRRDATYTNLDPGEYTMMVRAANNNGVWNLEGTSLEIEVLPPYWRSTIAYTIYALLGLAVIFLIIQINIRKQTYEREHKLNQSLRNLDKLKDEFLANTSHELRTPLNGIIGLSETMLDDDNSMPEDQKRNYIKMIHFSGKRLSNLVDDILDFSKLKSHTLNLNKRPIDLFEFVKNMIVMLEPLIGNKPLVINNNVPSSLPEICADEKRLQQIFFNLVGNAIKFTDSGSVSINARKEKTFLVIDIVDTGIGIPDDQLNKIFESFEQVDSDESRMYGGTGLGLTITQKLVELHGGTISVTSKAGAGSRFTMHFPIDRCETDYS